MVSRRVLGMEHEARTKLCKTMADLGWKCVGRTPKGAPNEFEKVIPDCGNAFYVRTAVGGRWRLEQYSGYQMQIRPGVTVAKMSPILTHRFETAVGMALWMDYIGTALARMDNERF